VRNVRLTLMYDGSDFHGWQVQPGVRTLQQTLTDAILEMTGERVVVHASGRTDAGVHALAQVAAFRLKSGVPTAAMQRALNALLPRSVRVTAADEVPLQFHPRRQAIAKTYRYRIYRGEVCPPFLRNYVYHHPYPLDEPAMMAAAAHFEGTHDFSSFATVARPRAGEPRPEIAAEPGMERSSNQRGTNVRTIFSSHLARSGEELVYEVRGNGFLHHMVRNMAGLLVEIGKGMRSVEELESVLNARRRSAAGRTAPAAGLYLVSVEYPAESV
jgi:tRNA pseudouridine38-40 synthase